MPQHIAVLGGGITGLTSTFHLARRFPSCKISLIEKETRLGGWIRSERIQASGHSVLLEAGPRTLRPNKNAVLELIHLLGLGKSLVRTLGTAPAAKTRYLHLPGTTGLTSLPSSISSLLKSKFLGLMTSSVARDFFLLPNLPEGVSDESVDSFLSRRFGKRFAEVFGSALVHGIYAADSRLLSMRSAFPSIWEAHLAGMGSVGRSMLLRPFQPAAKPRTQAYELGNIPNLMKGVSVFSFRDGLSALTDGLHRAILGMKNVEILNTRVNSLRSVNGGMIQISTADATLDATHVVSALPLPKLSGILTHGVLNHLDANPSSSVTVVNIVFGTSSEKIHPPGFGYLVPRANTRRSGVERCILGTVFDSSSLAEQDGSPGITKITVMMGGPHKTPAKFTPDELINALSQHLGCDLPSPISYRVYHHHDCIPIPTVGHIERMEELQRQLQAEPWNGKLAIVGAGVGGVSVGDCVEAGKDVAQRWG